MQVGGPERQRRRVAALTVAIAGCSGNPVNTGPFGGADWNTGQYCVPISHSGELVTDGFYDVRDSWRGTVAVISKISLVRPHGLRLVRLRCPPARPPALRDHAGPAAERRGLQYPWTDHVNAVGAWVPYNKHLSIERNLLLVVRTSARKSTDQGINVWYRVGSQEYQLRTGFELELVASPARC